jgi:hypothetical protein
MPGDSLCPCLGSLSATLSISNCTLTHQLLIGVTVSASVGS